MKKNRIQIRFFFQKPVPNPNLFKNRIQYLIKNRYKIQQISNPGSASKKVQIPDQQLDPDPRLFEFCIRSPASWGKLRELVSYINLENMQQPLIQFETFYFRI